MIEDELQKYLLFLSSKINKRQYKKVTKYELKNAVDLIIDYAIPILNSNRYFDVYILGIMGSGKTTLALQIAQKYIEKVGKDNVLYYYANPNNFENITQLADTLNYLAENNTKDDVVIVLDDFSFVVGRTQQDQEFKNLLSRIRHIFNKKKNSEMTPKILLIKIGHSLQSLPPLLRDAYAICFLSLNMNMLIDIKKYTTGISEKTINMFLALQKDGKVQYKDKEIVIDLINHRPLILIQGNNTYLCKFSKE